MAQVRWSEEALTALSDICDYIGKDAPCAAAMFASRIFEAADGLAFFPESGRIVPEFGRKEIRELIVGDDRVVYVLNDDTVQVAIVHHAARLLRLDPGDLT